MCPILPAHLHSMALIGVQDAHCSSLYCCSSSQSVCIGKVFMMEVFVLSVLNFLFFLLKNKRNIFL